MKPLFRFSIFVFCLLVGASGCGASQSDQPEVTKSQFIKRGNSICVETENEELGRASLYSKKHPNFQRADLILPALVLPLKKELKELESLGIPDGDEKTVEAIFQALQEGIKDAEAHPGDALNPTKNPFARANKLATAYGVKDCGRSP
jgi:hypothetical protein